VRKFTVMMLTILALLAMSSVASAERGNVGGLPDTISAYTLVTISR
jgi:hypothetical protein